MTAPTPDHVPRHAAPKPASPTPLAHAVRAAAPRLGFLIIGLAPLVVVILALASSVG